MQVHDSSVSSWAVWAFVLIGFPAAADTPSADTAPVNTAPAYTTAGIVSAATGLGGAFSPNDIATIYGTNLAWTTHTVTASDLVAGGLPTAVAGVSVYVNNLLCGIFFVSPGQINFLMPYRAGGPTTTIFVERQAVAGPLLTIPMNPVSPGLFQWNGNFAIAEHADGSLISAAAPAQGGEVIVLYAAGLGQNVPSLPPGSVVWNAATILAASQLRIVINGDLCDSCRIYYAGVTPGFAGLYQINVRLPDTLPPDPSIQIAIGTAMSPPGLQLYAQ